MFTCYVASTASGSQPFTDFREGADTVRLTGAISVDRCGEISTVPLEWRNQLRWSSEKSWRKTRLGVRSRTRVINE